MILYHITLHYIIYIYTYMHKLRQMGRLQYPVGWREAAGHPNFVVGQRRWLRSTQIAGKPTGNVGGWVWLSHIENLRPELCSYKWGN